MFLTPSLPLLLVLTEANRTLAHPKSSQVGLRRENLPQEDLYRGAER